MSPDFPMPKIPEGVSIMQQFALILEALKQYIAEGKKTGIVSMIRPDGTQLNPEGFTGGGAINAPWGVAIDGNDDVFVASGLGRGIAMLAGDGAKGHPAGTKPGDLIHFFQLDRLTQPATFGLLTTGTASRRRHPLIRIPPLRHGAEGRALPSSTGSRPQ
jgi:hypothetical protein